jgi:hypothetical protein
MMQSMVVGWLYFGIGFVSSLKPLSMCDAVKHVRMWSIWDAANSVPQGHYFGID